MDPRLAALSRPLANGVHVIRQAGGALDRVVVIGAGTIGLGCLQAALLRGAGGVTVVEGHPKRRQHASAPAADEAMEDLAAVKPGTDLVGDAAGSDARWQAAVDLLAPAGTASFVGLHSDQTSISWHAVIRANLRVQGSFGYADQDFQ